MIIVVHEQDMKSRLIFPIASSVAAITVSGLYPLAQFLALVPWGTGYVLKEIISIWLICLFASIILAIFSVVLVKGICRKIVIVLLIAALLIMPRPIATRIGDQIRHNAFVSLAERSKPLIRAIESFKQQNHALPKSLNDLVPQFLSAVPDTGMAAYPAYAYLVEDQGDAYALVISTPNAGIPNMDEFRYSSNGHYPDYGKHWENIGEWKYYHE